MITQDFQAARRTTFIDTLASDHIEFESQTPMVPSNLRHACCFDKMLWQILERRHPKLPLHYAEGNIFQAPRHRVSTRMVVYD